MENTTKDNNVSSEKVADPKPLELFGRFLMKFIEQSKIVRNYTVSEMIELSDKLKKEIDKIANFKYEDITSYGRFKAIQEVLDEEHRNNTLLRNLPY